MYIQIDYCIFDYCILIIVYELYMNFICSLSNVKIAKLLNVKIARELLLRILKKLFFKIFKFCRLLYFEMF